MKPSRRTAVSTVHHILSHSQTPKLVAHILKIMSARKQLDPDVPARWTHQKARFHYLPIRWRPYAELMRLGNPVGTLNTFFPYVLGSLYAACIRQPMANPRSILINIIWLFLAAFMEHCTGCSWNDIIDMDIDRLVTRTRSRPMARGAISPIKALVFTALECSTWLGVLSQVSTRCVLWALPLVGFIAFYPYTKRFTNYAQTALGITLAWGTIIGSVAVDIDPLDLARNKSWPLLAPVACLFAAYVIWTMMIDMIYAYQDLQDDVKAGVFSMAVRYRDHPKLTLLVLGFLQIGLLACSGILRGFSIEYLATTCASITSLNLWMIWSVDLRNSQQCWWWFQNGSLMMGAMMCLGTFVEYLNRLGIELS